jgi:hypothetical protein
MFALRVHGGIVRLREKKFMAVPLVNEAVGKSLSTMSGLFFLRLKEGGTYLAKEKGWRKKQKAHPLFPVHETARGGVRSTGTVPFCYAFALVSCCAHHTSGETPLPP